MAYFITQPRILYVLSANDIEHSNLLKIGEVFVDSSEAREYEDADMLPDLVREKLCNQPWFGEHDFKIELAKLTTYTSLEGQKSYKAQDIIDILSDSGYEPRCLKTIKREGESKKENADIWMPVTLSKVEKAIEAKIDGFKTIDGKPEPTPKAIVFRPEQEDAIESAISRFSTKTGKKFLWNAKMRFGKTLSALEVARRLGVEDKKKPSRPLVKTVLIVTHRPVVDSGWHDDFKKIFYDQRDVYK